MLHARSLFGRTTKNDAVSTSVLQLHSDFWLTLYYLVDEIRADGMGADAIHTGNLRIAYNISVKEISHPQGLDTNSNSLRAGRSGDRIQVEATFSSSI
jgi:hypothetical protein